MSSREKKMIIMLIVVFGSYLFYSFLLSPSIKKYDEVLVKLEKKEKRIIEMRSYGDEIQKLKDKILENEGIYKSISINYFVGYMQEDLGMDMDKLISSTGIDVSSIDVSKPIFKRVESVIRKSEESHGSILDTYYEQYKGKVTGAGETEKQAQSIDPIDVKGSNVSMNLTGNFKQIIAFIKAIEEYPKKILIDNISFNTSSEEGEIFTVVMTLTAYMMPGERRDEVDEFFKSSGRDNPFATTGADNTNYYQERNTDFYLLLKPSSSDINSMTLKTKNGGMEELITIKSEKEEEATIQIKMIDDKPVFRYSFGNKASYPSEAGKFAPLTMNNEGVIFLKVDSQKRNNNDDNKVNMRILNETPYPFIYKIFRDDIKDPRFNIKDFSGNVQED